MVDFLPLVTKAFVGSVALDLVPVIPMDGSNSPDEFKKMRSDIKIENRERRIDSVIGGIKIEEMKIEDHKDYKKSKPPSCNLFYMDYTYGGTSSTTS